LISLVEEADGRAESVPRISLLLVRPNQQYD
jgi:hypothetical protein